MEYRSWLTPYLIAKELEMVMKREGFPTSEPTWEVAYDIASDHLLVTVKCGVSQIALSVDSRDLQRSLDDYSQQFVEPAVQLMKAEAV